MNTRRSPKGEKRRRVILDAARDLFAQGGYHTASLADIAASAGLSQAGLLHHFPSKSELLLAVLDDRDEERTREEDLRSREGLDYVNGYLHILAKSDAQPALSQLNAMISAEALSDSHPAHEHFVELYRTRVKTVSDALEPLLDADLLPPGVTATTVARWAIAMADGMRYQVLYEEEPVDRTRIIAGFFESLRPYMRDRSTPIDLVAPEA